MERKEKMAGIIGGMGPEATVDLMARIIKNTPAFDDADHIRCIVDNNPKIPSRIKALIEGTGENPGPAMIDMGRRLEAYGADFLCIPCNTAHNYYSHVRDAVKIPVLNMIGLAVTEALAAGAPSKDVGILASPAVRTTGLYSGMLESYGARAVYPDAQAEADLLALIRGIKAGQAGAKERDVLAEVAADLVAKGVGVIIVACTELGIIMDGQDFGVPVVDAAEALACAIVREAKNK